MTIYRWDKKHWNRLKKHISWDESRGYISALLKNSQQDLEPPKIQEYPEKEDPLKTYAKMVQKINKSLVKEEDIDYKISQFAVQISTKITSGRLNLKKILEEFHEDNELTAIAYEKPPYPIEVKMKKITMFLFSSGKCTVTGVRDVRNAKEFIKKIIKKLSVTDLDIIENPIIKANNICATAKLSAEFALDDVKTLIILENEMATILNESDQLIAIPPSKKEKEGKIKYITDSKLSYRFRDSGIKVEFYKSGKVVIRGVRDERDINETVEKLSNYLFFKPFIYHSAG